MMRQNNKMEWNGVVLGNVGNFSGEKRKFFTPLENRFMSKCLETAHFSVRNTSSTRSLFTMTNFCAEISLQEEISCIQKSSTNQTTPFKSWGCIDFLIDMFEVNK